MISICKNLHFGLWGLFFPNPKFLHQTFLIEDSRMIRRVFRIFVSKSTIGLLLSIIWMSISAAVCPISNAGCWTTVIGGLNNSSLTIAAGITNHKDDGNPVIDSSSRFISYWDQSDGKVDNGKVGVGLIVPGYKKVVFKNEFGKESQNVVFSSSDKNAPAKFYINSETAHRK